MRTKDSKKKRFIISIISINAIILCFLLNVSIQTVNGHSMKPLYKTGDKVIMLRNFYGIRHWKQNRYFFIWKKPQANDIIVFKDKGSGEQFIKRITAIPGDNVIVTPYMLILPSINIPLNEDGFEQLKGLKWIPDDSYLVIGDNFFNSQDSRELGLIHIDRIQGKILFSKKIRNHGQRQI